MCALSGFGGGRFGLCRHVPGARHGSARAAARWARAAHVAHQNACEGCAAAGVAERPSPPRPPPPSPCSSLPPSPPPPRRAQPPHARTGFVSAACHAPHAPVGARGALRGAVGGAVERAGPPCLPPRGHAGRRRRGRALGLRGSERRRGGGGRGGARGRGGVGSSTRPRASEGRVGAARPGPCRAARRGSGRRRSPAPAPEARSLP